jgi:hypothetical protein
VRKQVAVLSALTFFATAVAREADAVLAGERLSDHEPKRIRPGSLLPLEVLAGGAHLLRAEGDLDPWGRI